MNAFGKFPQICGGHLINSLQAGTTRRSFIKVKKKAGKAASAKTLLLMKISFSADLICEGIEFLIDDIHVRFRGLLFRVIINCELLA